MRKQGLGTERNNRKELQRVRGRGGKREERKALGSQSEGSEEFISEVTLTTKYMVQK